MPSAPGESYAYSNSSYSLIGCVVERLSGEPFWEYCQQAVFAPLEMKDSSWRLADLDRGRYAYTYAREGDSLKNEQPFTWPGYMDGGLRTTMEDIGHFLVMMANHGTYLRRQVLKPETIETMLALQNPPGAPPGRGFPTLGRGFVWILSEVEGRRVFQMNGFGPTFFCQVFFDPATQAGGAFFTTGGFRSFQDLGRMVRGTFGRLLDAAEGTANGPGR